MDLVECLLISVDCKTACIELHRCKGGENMCNMCKIFQIVQNLNEKYKSGNIDDFCAEC